ncbi:MAG: NUDIX hydrolase [Berkelbacteria bacterium GW2011_GWA2_38_9]|uniref:NUDIX hydrolase n=1 Tax=Berkelbacteria bacterium GW2011_GWA2_38_9 TaxID=1618334 RepID=A0A0G0LFM9_9BACT|nr:MAG: NUDIX hydrolase [Berkelbacteria bacterium GW2011_GWA2_38_9]
MKQKNQNIPAVYLVLIKDNKILLLRRFNTGFEDGKYSMIAGHVEKGESFTQSIIREAQEEAGILVRPKNLKFIHFMHRIVHNHEESERVDVFFQVTNWQGEIVNQEPQKCDDLAWFDLNDLPTNTIPYIKQAIERINNGISYSEFGWS